MKQDETLAKIGEFLGIPMAKIEVRPELVGRWKTDTEEHDFNFFAEELVKYNY